MAVLPSAVLCQVSTAARSVWPLYWTATAMTVAVAPGAAADARDRRRDLGAFDVPHVEVAVDEDLTLRRGEEGAVARRKDRADDAVVVDAADAVGVGDVEPVLRVHGHVRREADVRVLGR